MVKIKQRQAPPERYAQYIQIRNCMSSKWTMWKARQTAILFLRSMYSKLHLCKCIRNETTQLLINTVESQCPQTRGAAKKTFRFGLLEESNEWNCGKSCNFLLRAFFNAQSIMNCMSLYEITAAMLMTPPAKYFSFKPQ